MVLKDTRDNNEKRTAMFSCLTLMKSIVASIRASIIFIYKFYVGFCKETTLHGLQHTVNEELHWFERFLWLVLTIAAFTGGVFCALSQFDRYNSEPVVVSMQRDYRDWWTNFPAITACFAERVQEDKARETIETIWNVTEESNPDMYQYYMEFINLVADVSFRDNLQNFWKYQSDNTLKDIDLLQLALNVHPFFLFKVALSQTNKKARWHPVMTEVGMCVTFNSQYAEYQYMLQDVQWTPENLLKCHYHSGQCYVRIDSMNNAVRYFIHSPFEISTAISNPTGEVRPGEELIIDFKAVEIQAASGVRSLRVEQRRCRYPDEWLSSSIKAYSFSLCQMHCRSRMAVMFCGCRPYFHVKGGEEYKALTRFSQWMAMYVTRTAWLVSAATSKYLSIYPKTSQNATAYPNVQKSTTTLIQRRSLFASLGGTTALFVGASVLTVVETVFFFFRYVVNILLSRRMIRKVAVVNLK